MSQRDLECERGFSYESVRDFDLHLGAGGADKRVVCVVVWHTNRYGRAIDRGHELAELVEKGVQAKELRLRIRQLEAAETRTLLIVRALTCF